MELQEVLKAVIETESEGEATLDEILKEAKVSEKGMAAAKGALRILQAFKEEMPKDLLEKLGTIAGYAMPTKTKSKGKKTGESDDGPNDYQYPEPAKKSLEGLPAEIRKDVEGILKANADEVANLKKQNEEVQKTLKAERDARELEQWTTRAKTDLSHVPGKSAEELGKTFKALHDTNPELAKAQFDTMKAASEAIQKSALFHESGSGAAGGNGNGSAWDKMEAMAKGLVEKAEGGKINFSKAMAKVMKDHPELYKDYLEEHPDQTHKKPVE